MDFRWECFDNSESNLLQMLNLRILADVELTTEDRSSYIVHHAILASLGKKTYQKLVDDIKVDPKEKHQNILLKFANRDVLQIFVDYLYQNSINFEPINVWKVLDFAKYYDIANLVNECFSYLQNRINLLNCMKIFHSSVKTNHPITSQIDSFLKKNFLKILDTNPDFFTIDYEHLQKILDDDNLNAPNEMFVWETISKWINCKINERLIYFENLFKTVRWGRLDLQYLRSTIATNTLVKSNETFSKSVNDIIENYNKLSNTTKDEHDLYANKDILFIRPRIPQSLIFVYGGWKNGITTDSIEVYDSQTNIWFETNISGQVQRSYHGLEFLNDRIYIIGGTDGEDVKNTLIRFDPKRKLTKKMASMQESRCYVSTTCLGGYIFAMGGHNGNQRMDSCEKYVPDVNLWVPIASMNVVRSDACATTYKNKIYIAGGLNSNSVENSVEVYDPQNDTWTLIAQMISPRTSFALIAYNNKMFAIGGNDGYERISSVECYDFYTKEWLLSDDMIHRRSTFRAVVFNEELYAIGGYNGISPIKYVEKYNNTLKKWIEVQGINQDRSGFGAIAIDLTTNNKNYTFNGK